MRRALRITGRIYLAGMIVMAASLLVLRCKSLGMQGLSAGFVAHNLITALLWPVFVVLVVLVVLGVINIE